MKKSQSLKDYFNFRKNWIFFVPIIGLPLYIIFTYRAFDYLKFKGTAEHKKFLELEDKFFNKILFLVPFWLLFNLFINVAPFNSRRLLKNSGAL